MRLKLPGVTLHWGSKDGGPESRVFMYGIECKAIASALVLRFEHGSREAYHSHAFNAVSWILNDGCLHEEILDEDDYPTALYRESGLIRTARACTHKVSSSGTTWVLSLRGPWASQWTEVVAGERVTLKNGRVRA